MAVKLAVAHSSVSLLRKAPPLVASLFIAETAFKFGSFTAECLAFLALWYALDWVSEQVLRLRRP